MGKRANYWVLNSIGSGMLANMTYYPIVIIAFFLQYVLSILIGEGFRFTQVRFVTPRPRFRIISSFGGNDSARKPVIDDC